MMMMMMMMQGWRVGVVIVAVLSACVLRATTKKVINFLGKNAPQGKSWVRICLGRWFSLGRFARQWWLEKIQENSRPPLGELKSWIRC